MLFMPYVTKNGVDDLNYDEKIFLIDTMKKIQVPEVQEENCIIAANYSMEDGYVNISK